MPLQNQEDDFSILANFMKNDGSGESSDQNFSVEGQLSVDVAQTKDEIIIVALLAGCRPQDVELHLHSDVLTIRGQRKSPILVEANYFFRECYWGKFSRTIVLPVAVKEEMTRAEFKNGVLTVVLPKANNDGNIPIIVVEE